MSRSRIFLLSPANTGGARAQMLLNPRAGFDLARQLQAESARLDELYSFISGLYFRGKVAYAQAFSAPPDSLPHALVITPGRGLLPSDTLITADELRTIAQVPVEITNAPYREPLERDARVLAQHIPEDCDLVLLGSVATPKYVQPLMDIFGERLLFPPAFVGRGDMSRGGLMLRCSRSGEELEYAPIQGAVRHGPRPPKLPRLWKP